MTLTVNDMANQAGRVAIVTGANAGLGFETALALAGAGAEVIVAARSPEKGEDAARRIIQAHPRASVRFERLDLASLADVAAFSARITGRHERVDLLVNNAGVMAPPQRHATQDGFELQFGVNYLGHFALTARLLPLLRRGTATRVVSLSSGAHHMGAIRFDDPQWTQGYRPWPAYGQSKLAMLMFALELQRRSDIAGWGLMSNAAHPGFARTELIRNGPGLGSVMSRVTGVLQPWISQSAADGALPTLYAATSPDARGAAYYGPTGALEMKGPPGPARIARPAQDEDAAKRLWNVSEQLTGVAFGNDGA